MIKMFVDMIKDLVVDWLAHPVTLAVIIVLVSLLLMQWAM